MSFVHMPKDITLSFFSCNNIYFQYFPENQDNSTKGFKGHQIYGESSKIKSGFKRNKHNSEQVSLHSRFLMIHSLMIFDCDLRLWFLT